jgi:hypothetical protein
MLCKYRHVFGAEKTGFHSYRLFDVAIGDLVLTILFGILLAKWLNVNSLVMVLFLLVLGVVLHRLFCVNTRVNMLLFGKVASD